MCYHYDVTEKKKTVAEITEIQGLLCPTYPL